MRTRELESRRARLARLNEEYTRQGIKAITDAVSTSRNRTFVFKNKPIAIPLDSNLPLEELEIQLISETNGHVYCLCMSRNGARSTLDIMQLSVNYEDVLESMVKTVKGWTEITTARD